MPIIDKFDFLGKTHPDSDAPKEFDSLDHVRDYMTSQAFKEYLIKTHGIELPLVFIVQLKPQPAHNNSEKLLKQKPYVVTVQFSRQGIAMDWEYYSGLVSITPEAVAKESNIEKRRLLMMELGLANYAEEIKTLAKDAYGELISMKIEGAYWNFLKLVNGTQEKAQDYIKYLQSKEMISQNNHRLYFQPIPNELKSAKEAVAWTWDIDPNWLPDSGWEFDA